MKGIETSSKAGPTIKHKFQPNRNSPIGHGDLSEGQILSLVENRH
jgi:hypothetical protein